MCSTIKKGAFLLCRESAKNHRRKKKFERYQQDSFIPTAWCNTRIHNEAGAHRQVLNLCHLAPKGLIVKVGSCKYTYLPVWGCGQISVHSYAFLVCKTTDGALHFVMPLRHDCPQNPNISRLLFFRCPANPERLCMPPHKKVVLWAMFFLTDFLRFHSRWLRRQIRLPLRRPWYCRNIFFQCAPTI